MLTKAQLRDAKVQQECEQLTADELLERYSHELRPGAEGRFDLALTLSNLHVPTAATLLGCSRWTVYAWIREYGPARGFELPDRAAELEADTELALVRSRGVVTDAARRLGITHGAMAARLVNNRDLDTLAKRLRLEDQAAKLGFRLVPIERQAPDISAPAVLAEPGSDIQPGPPAEYQEE